MKAKGDVSIFTPEEFKKISRKKVGKQEEKLQLAVCDYIRGQYPAVIFMCDLASGMKMPIWLAARNKRMRSSRGLPDLFIAGTIKVGEAHVSSGLFIELKKEGTRLKNGDMPKDDHVKEQAEILERLRRLGYVAEFACGYDEATKLIDKYLSV